MDRQRPDATQLGDNKISSTLHRPNYSHIKPFKTSVGTNDIVINGCFIIYKHKL